ncbi:sensor histidine kinase [Sphingomonas mesophila]|uniref:sensor histidine kinase n=1 Tax=Sphingomonas mesophila TaxID=2303576 RepID=UPI000E580637|nr:ATP-binding protein [Sphingomonas mesophila]
MPIQPKRESRINRLGIAGLVTSFALLIVAFAFVLYGFSANRRASEQIVATYDVKDIVSEAGRDLERAEAARRGYLLDPAPFRLRTFRETTQRLLPGLDQVRFRTGHDPVQQVRAEKLKALVIEHIASMNTSIELVRSGRAEEARRQFDVSGDSARIRVIRSLADGIEESEEERLTRLLSSERATVGWTQWLLAGVGLALIIATLGTMSMLRRFTRDLLASQARLNLLNTNLEGAVAERTADLRRANDEIQRFAYIVSHDLRSPLVNVMGFTSELESAGKAITRLIDKLDSEQPGLVDEPARLAAREDLPEALGFIRAATEKMDRLINAILTLSRQGRRVLTPERLEMNALIGEIVSGSLATQAEARGATITIDGTLPDLNHDRLAVEQVFQNLLENATKYGRPGVPNKVVVSGRSQGPRAIFEVADTGRGIPPEDHERVFELFRRSGAQDQPGEGIGLAHVRALAYRLGGTISLRSTPGEGATFIVDLPATYDTEGDS